jgi:hypothetical protein
MKWLFMFFNRAIFSIDKRHLFDLHLLNSFVFIDCPSQRTAQFSQMLLHASSSVTFTYFTCFRGLEYGLFSPLDLS